MTDKLLRELRDLQTQEVIVVRNVDHFPVYDKEFASNTLSIGINLSGTAKALYDLQEVTFTKNEVAVVLPNHILKLLSTSKDYQLALIVMSHKFADELMHVTMNHDHHKFHLTPATLLTDTQAAQWMKMMGAVELISKMSTSELPNRHEALLRQVDIAFEVLNSFRREQDSQARLSREMVIFHQFCDLLAQHYRQEHEIAFYAQQLHINPKYLSLLIHKAVGVTAGDWIDEYLLLQIKKVLETRPEFTVQQVAYEFGFKCPSTFCRFFKHLTGISPLRYRQEAVKK